MVRWKEDKFYSYNKQALTIDKFEGYDLIWLNKNSVRNSKKGLECAYREFINTHEIKNDMTYSIQVGVEENVATANRLYVVGFLYIDFQ